MDNDADRLRRARFYPNGAAVPDSGAPPFLVVTDAGDYAFDSAVDMQALAGQFHACGVKCKMMVRESAWGPSG